MGNFSVKAILSAVDKNFSSTMKSALGYTNNLKDTLKSGFGFGVLMGAGQQAFSAIAGSVKGLSNETVETSDSMQKLQQAMRFSGYAESEIQRIAGATGTLKTYADKTVFSLQDVMSTFGALSANGIQDADKMTEAVGNAVAVFGGGAKEFSAVGLAYSQAMAAGALHAQDWNQILNASPQLAGGLKKELIKLNPVLGEDFKQAMEDGAITADLLGQAMNNIGMTDLAKEAATSVTTFEGAMGNLQATAVSGMMGLYDTFAKSTVIDAINKFNEKVGAGFDWLNANIPNAIAKIRPYWMAFKSDFDEVKVAFGDAVSAIGDSLSELTGAFGTPQNIKSFSDGLGVATDALKTFAGFCEEHSDTIAKLITKLPKLYIAYRGFKIVKAVAPFVGAFTGAIGGLAKMGLSKIAPMLFGVAKGQDAVGKSSGASSNKMLKSAKSFMMLGAGVLAVSAGFYLLAQSATSVADAGPLAVGVLAGLVGAVTILSFGMMSLLKNVKTTPSKLNAVSNAFLKMSGGIALIIGALSILALALVPLTSLGTTAVPPLITFGVVVGGLAIILGSMGKKLQESAVGIAVFAGAVSVMALAMTPIAQTGTEGAVAMGAFGLVVAGLVAVFGLFGSALNAAIPGMIAFGLTILAVGAGMALAEGTISALPPLVKQLGDTFSQMASSIADAVSQVVTVVGDTLCNVMTTAGDVISQVVDSISDGFKTIADGVSGVIDAISGGFTSVLEAVADIISAIGESAKNAGTGFKSVAEGISMISGLSIGDIAKSLGAVAMGLGEISGKGDGLQSAASGMAGIRNAITGASSETAVLNGLLSQLSGTAVAASTSVLAITLAFSGLKIPNLDVSPMLVAFAAITAAATVAMNLMINSFENAAVRATVSGKEVGSGFSNGVQNGLNKLPSIASKNMAGFNSGLRSGGSMAVSIARNITNSIVAALGSARSGAYSSGYYIGQGFANGMASTLGYVRSVATQLAAAADAAIVAKAKIGSPSKVTTKLGKWYGIGWVNGIKNEVKAARNAAKELVQMPKLPRYNDMELQFAGTGGMTLNDDYDYSADYKIYLELTSNIDGREVSKATAKYDKDELEKLQKISNRIKGIR